MTRKDKKMDSEIQQEFIKTILVRFEQYDYILKKFCSQFGLDADILLNEAREEAERKVGEKLAKAEDSE